MKVLIVVDHAVSGRGPHRNVVGTLNALSERKDVQVTLLTEKIDEAEPYAKSKKFKTVLSFSPHNYAKIISNFFQVFKLAKQSDLLYVPSGLKACLYVALVAKILRKPMMSGPNVTHLPFRKADSPGDFEVKWLTDLWFEASERRRDYVRTHVSENLKSKVLNIHHAIDLNKFSPRNRDIKAWKRFNIPIESTKVLYVGRDDIPLKGVKQLLDAIETLGDKYDIDFVFAGRMSEETQSRAKKHKNIHLLGFQTGPSLSEIYASSDISIVPSSWENFPFTVLEAMASGLAIVASRTGGIPEMIEHNKNGILIDVVGSDGTHLPETSERIATAVQSLVENVQLRKTLGKEARLTAERRFSEKQLGENLVGHFKQVKQVADDKV